MNTDFSDNAVTENNRALTPREPPDRSLQSQRGILIGNMNDLARFAKMIYDSGLAPKGFSNMQSVAIAVEMGLELGMTPMMALQNIGVINGRPGIFGDAAKALIEASGLMADYSEHPGRWCDVCEREGDAKNKCPKCGGELSAAEHHGFIATSLRAGRRYPVVSGFNIRMAKKAGLWGKQGPWTQYPNRMLMFRARGFNLRDNFPDVLKGFKTTEELDDYPSRSQPIVMDHVSTVDPAAPTTRHEPAQEAENKKATEPRKITRKSMMLLNELASDLGLTPVDREELCQQAGVSTFDELSEENALSIIRDLADAKKRRDEQAREPGQEG